MHQMAYINTCLFQIQLVGFNAKLYPNLTVASSKNHGIVVVSVLVQVSPKTSSDFSRKYTVEVLPTAIM